MAQLKIKILFKVHVLMKNLIFAQVFILIMLCSISYLKYTNMVYIHEGRLWP